MQPGSSSSFGGFVVSSKPVSIDVPWGHRFHLSGASLPLDAPPGRVVLSIHRPKPFGDEPPGTFPIAVLRAGRAESTFLDLFIAGGEGVELHRTGASAVSVIGSLVHAPHESGAQGGGQNCTGGPGYELHTGGYGSDSGDTQSASCSSEDMGLILPSGPCSSPSKDAQAEQRNATWACLPVEAAPRMSVGRGTKRCQGPKSPDPAGLNKRLKRKPSNVT